MTRTPEQAWLRKELTEIGGRWDAAWERLAELDPGFVRAYVAMAAVPARRDRLGARVRAFVGLAVDAAATHLYVPGIRTHIRAALAAGASARELTEVLELTSTLGIHASNVGVPLLLEVLEEEGQRSGPVPLDARQEALRARFRARRGYWHETFEGLLELDPELFEAYLAFSSVPWRSGVLEPKVKEFVYTAFDASATHLYAPGLKLHMRNAVRLGASRAELMEVLEIAGLVGVHAATVAAPVLAEELAAAREEPERGEPERGDRSRG